MTDPEYTGKGNKVRIEGNTEEKTYCGKIKFYRDKMEIQQKGNFLSKGWITIHYKNIESITTSTTQKLKIVTNANDYYVSLFSSNNTNIIGWVKERVNEIQNPGGNNESSQDSVADEIRKLAELNEEGILTDEEFERKKQDLL
jgi:hypothetical protein